MKRLPPIHFAPVSPIAVAYRSGLDGLANLYPARGHQYTAWRLGCAAKEHRETKVSTEAKLAA